MSKPIKQWNNLKSLWRNKRYRIAIILIVLTGLGFQFGPWRNQVNRINMEEAHIAKVQRGNLVVSILQSGELQARNSREMSNEAYKDSKIIDIVEDGVFVTNGQLLVELESSELQDRYLQQKSKAASAEAELEISKLEYATDLESARLKVELAKLALKKYDEAEYTQSVDRVISEISLAEQELKKARSTLDGTKTLYEKGYANRDDLDSDQLGVDRKEIDLRNKRKDLEILVNYTHEKQLKELKNDVATATSDYERLKKTFASELQRNEASLSIEMNQLATREEQLTNTKIYADFDGQVFYAKKRSRRHNEIEKGAQVHYRQPILSFPDMSAWNIKVGVPEAMIDRISIGQEAVASVEAVPGLLLRANVSKISAVPESQHWFSTGVKTYSVILEVDKVENAQLKPGMSTTVEIVTDRLTDVIYAPIQSVVTKGDSHYVYVVKRKRKTLREIEAGKYNNDYIEVVSGLDEGEELLLYAEVEMEAEVNLVDSPLEVEDEKKPEKE